MVEMATGGLPYAPLGFSHHHAALLHIGSMLHDQDHDENGDEADNKTADANPANKEHQDPAANSGRGGGGGREGEGAGAGDQGELLPPGLEVGEEFSDRAVDFLRCALSRDPSRRPPPASLLRHPFIRPTAHSAGSSGSGGGGGKHRQPLPPPPKQRRSIQHQQHRSGAHAREHRSMFNFDAQQYQHQPPHLQPSSRSPAAAGAPPGGFHQSMPNLLQRQPWQMPPTPPSASTAAATATAGDRSSRPPQWWCMARRRVHRGRRRCCDWRRRQRG